MDALVGTILGTGWASGVNLYGTALLLGLLGRFDIASTPELLQQPWVLGIAGAMYLLEFFVDKIPYVDSMWDTVHTVIRPLGAAMIGGELAGEDLSQLFGGGVAGVTALASHAAKAGARMAINTSPEPVTNVAVSLTEDVAVAGMVWFAVTYPWLAGALALLLIVLGAIVLAAAWKMVRRGRLRFKHWRARRTAAAMLR